MRLVFLKSLVVLFTAICLGGCKNDELQWICVRAERSTSAQSAFPVAIDIAKVGKYAAVSKSGAGYFYDEVLEYRVWFHPEQGAEPLNGKDDYYIAFTQCEKAEELSKSSKGAEAPLVLVRQYEWIDEPKPGRYISEKGNRITEWQVKWLAGSKRTPESISEFLKHPRPASHSETPSDKEQ
jgi:hypothetical protein